MTTTSTTRVVKVALDTTKSSLAKNGARVSVELPSGDAVHGRISSVGKVATSAAGSDSGAGGGGGGGDSSGATISVTIHLSKIQSSLDEAPVTVGFEQERRRNVLAIPVTALLAQPGGAYAVEVVESDGTRRVVPVDTGLYTSGFVEIDGDGLQPGMRVTNAAV
jgi:multidrug efflux pump subunit AcrA (membrane-fusion protein)